MDKKFFKECVELEVYGSYKDGKLSLIDKIWCRFFRPESNSVYLIRRYLYLSSLKGKINLCRSRICLVKLMRRYGIYISRSAKIGKGLSLIHPFGIFITGATVGENLTLHQNCTIGTKVIGATQAEACPQIGKNVVMYANSMIVGPVTVGDNAVIGSNAVLTKNAEAKGVYAGTPAVRIK